MLELRFNLAKSAHSKYNTLPFLADEKVNQVLQLRDILSFFEANRKMDEDWLIDMIHSLAPQGMT